MTGASGSAPGPASGRLPTEVSSASAVARDAGLALLARLSSLIRVGRSYQPDNQVFVHQLEGFLETVGPVLEQSGEAVLVTLDGDLYLNGARIPIRGTNIKFHRHILEEFARREISGFRVVTGVGIEELKTFFRLFLQSDLYSGAQLLEACLAHGGDHVLPAVYASTRASEAILPSAPQPPPPALGSEGTAAARSTPDAGGAEAGFDRPLPGDRGAGGAADAPRGVVRKSYSAAVAGARALLTTTSLQGGTELRHAKRVVQPLVDGAFASEPVVVGLSTLTHHDEYTYAHAVNVCLVAVTMGHYLEMDRRALADLGVAALLHDAGKSAVAGQIRNPLESFSPEELRLAERHPVEGVKVLARSTTLNATTLRCMRVALEHHAGPEGSGYPGFGSDWHISMLSRIVAVADCFVSLQTHRSARGAMVTPFEALGMMLGPLRHRFHPAMLWALVQTLGLYPPGQLVELDDASIAVVLAPNPDDVARPHLRPILSPAGERLGEEVEDLRPLPAGRTIRRALTGAEYPEQEIEAA